MASNANDEYKVFKYYEGMCSSSDFPKEIAKILALGVKSKPVKDIDIDKYKDVEEEGSVDDSSYGYLNNDFADDVTVDSAAVDDEAVLDTVF